MDAEITGRAKDYLAEKGYDPVFGARPLKRLIQKEIVNEISMQFVKGVYKPGAVIIVDTCDEGLRFLIKD